MIELVDRNSRRSFDIWDEKAGISQANSAQGHVKGKAARIPVPAPTPIQSLLNSAKRYHS